MNYLVENSGKSKKQNVLNCGNTARIVDIFSIFHDGTIENWSGNKKRLTLKIGCQYLAARINPEFEYFYVDILDIKAIELDTYRNETDKTPIVINEIDKIFCEKIDIYYAKTEKQFVEINCWQVNEKLGYVANSLRICCGSADVFNQNREQITFSNFAKISDDYWNDFRNRNENNK